METEWTAMQWVRLWVAVTYPIGEKEVKDAVKELNPDTDSLGSRG